MLRGWFIFPLFYFTLNPMNQRKEALKKEEYVYRDCKISMSTKSMASLLYAAIITKASIPTTYGIGIYDYSRVQNCRNLVDVKIHIHPSQVERFEKEAGTSLNMPVSVTINNTL